jgi:integrase
MPVHPDLLAALDVLPLPRGSKDADCPWFFWSGNGSKLAAIRDLTRTLETVFNASGVVNACSHRFRHMLATELLEIGASIEEVADILGDSEAIVRKHYIKWSRGRQARINTRLQQLWRYNSGTGSPANPETVQNEWDEVVDEMGFEPTTPALRTPCSPS